nr:PepSY-associated TM helix domain-containing protein [Paraflavitalea speifideiaquila]
MTISVWRYSHFALAVSSFLFIVLAAVTGIVLAFEPITGKIPSYKGERFDELSLAQTIPALPSSFSSVTTVSVDANQFVVVKGTDVNGKPLEAYVDPATGKVLGKPGKQHAFYQWVTALHRSLFLHEVGRFFVGLAAFLLMLIAITGALLVVKRQRGWKRFYPHRQRQFRTVLPCGTGPLVTDTHYPHSPYWYLVVPGPFWPAVRKEDRSPG